MKKQIGGKRYSTTAARKIGYGEDESGELGCMYVKRNGESFLALKSHDLKPLTEEQALKWAKANRLLSQYTEAVDYAINEKRQVSVYLTEIALQSLKKLCKLWGTSQSEALEKILQDGYTRAVETERIKEQLLKELEIQYGFKP